MPIFKPLVLAAAASFLLAAAAITAPGVLAEEICRTYQRGNKIITEYCPGDWKCAEAKLCRLSPEKQKMLSDFQKALKDAQQMHLRGREASEGSTPGAPRLPPTGRVQRALSLAVQGTHGLLAAIARPVA